METYLLCQLVLTNCGSQTYKLFTFSKLPFTFEPGYYINNHYVVVQFYPWLNFYFPLFFFLFIYDNEYKKIK